MAKAREPPPGWITISDLARARGVDKSAVSRRVARLETAGLLKTRVDGNVKLVNIAEYARATAETVDAVREANGSARQAEGAERDLVLAREQARRAAIEATLKQMDLDERVGRLVETEAVRANLDAIVIEFGQALDALHTHAEALAAVVAKSGVVGLRAALKAISREQREALARAAERFADDNGDEDKESPAAILSSADEADTHSETMA